MKRLSEVEIASTINDLPIMAGSKGQARRLIMCGKVAQAQLEADRKAMRTLLKEIENTFVANFEAGEGTVLSISRIRWRALKDKFLKEE